MVENDTSRGSEAFLVVCVGIHCAPNGVQTMRLRPSLIFQHHHADIFLESFDKVLAESK